MNLNKIIKTKYICTTGGVVAPNAICGAVSVYSDDKGHRCTAHGNTKCKFKKVNENEPN